MALTTTPAGLWILQALLGVETLPAALRLRYFIPSLHDSLIVETTAGPLPVAETAEYASLVAAGVIDGSGHVDDTVRDWLTVLGRPERQVVLTIRRPCPRSADIESPTVQERVLVVCRHRRWMALCARDGEEVVIDAVGESDRPDEQAELMCNALLPAFGDAEPAPIEGANIPVDLMKTTLNGSAPLGRERLVAGLSRLGLAPQLIEVLAAVVRVDESAMGVVSVIDKGITTQVHQQVVTVADTEYGRVTITTSAAADGREWMTVWPTTVAGLRDDLTGLLSARQAA
jgi:EspG family